MHCFCLYISGYFSNLYNVAIKRMDKHLKTVCTFQELKTFHLLVKDINSKTILQFKICLENILRNNGVALTSCQHLILAEATRVNGLQINSGKCNVQPNSLTLITGTVIETGKCCHLFLIQIKCHPLSNTDKNLQKLLL